MKLKYNLLLKITPVMLVFVAVWAMIFYATIIDEVNDEMDDSLEGYSENVIRRFLSADGNIPYTYDAFNNSYTITEIIDDKLPRVQFSYSDSMVYVKQKHEYEPARILKTAFQTEDHRAFSLEVSTPTIDKEDLKDSILKSIIALYLLFFFLLLALIIWTTDHTLRPLYALIEWLNHYTLGKAHKDSLAETNIKEFAYLNETAITNIRRIEDAFEQQKNFISNASHEMQTPIAVCQNQLEFLMSDSHLTAKQLESISVVYSTIRGIARTNKTLLLLSKIENKQEFRAELVSLSELISQQVDILNDIYASKGISIHVDCKQDIAYLMNKQLASILISNLIKNALVHNVEGGEVWIKMYDHQISITNTGAIDALDSKLIFNRFYSSGRQDSTGLGLSMVLAIAKLYNIDISYCFTSSMNHQFVLHFRQSN